MGRFIFLITIFLNNFLIFLTTMFNSNFSFGYKKACNIKNFGASAAKLASLIYKTAKKQDVQTTWGECMKAAFIILNAFAWFFYIDYKMHEGKENRAAFYDRIKSEAGQLTQEVLDTYADKLKQSPNATQLPVNQCWAINYAVCVSRILNTVVYGKHSKECKNLPFDYWANESVNFARLMYAIDNNLPLHTLKKGDVRRDYVWYNYKGVSSDYCSIIKVQTIDSEKIGDPDDVMVIDNKNVCHVLEGFICERQLIVNKFVDVCDNTPHILIIKPQPAQIEQPQAVQTEQPQPVQNLPTLKQIIEKVISKEEAADIIAQRSAQQKAKEEALERKKLDEEKAIQQQKEELAAQQRKEIEAQIAQKTAENSKEVLRLGNEVAKLKEVVEKQPSARARFVPLLERAEARLKELTQTV